MSDLISRKRAIKALQELNGLKLTRIFNDSPVQWIDRMFLEAEGILRTLPSAEPERKKGKWVRRKDEDCWECSVCHAVLENSDIGNHNFYYCYHCGADMMDICGYMDLEKANYE